MKKLSVFLTALLFVTMLLSGCSVENTNNNSMYAESTSNNSSTSRQENTSQNKSTLPANDNIIAGNHTLSETSTSTQPNTAAIKIETQKEFRGIWLAIYELSPSRKSMTEKEYRKKIDSIMENLLTIGVTDVFAQVRANCDSIYPSNYFKPYSPFEKDGSLIFDALKIIVSSAHDHGIKIHAWINPYRISAKDGVRDDDKIFNSVGKSDIYTSGNKAYLKPVSDNAKKLVLNGVREILTYGVDGIHIDDYFYPTGDKKIDADEYSAYKNAGGSLPLDDWRRSNVSSLVSSIYSLVKSSDSNRIFSISPGGDIEKNCNNLYADVKLWCSTPGYTDMIIPQIYFGFENDHQPFKRCLDSWKSIVTCDNVKLAVGLAAYKADSQDDYAGKGKNEWKQSNDIIKRQVEYLREKNCNGFVLFSYHYVFVDNNLINSEMQNLKTVL